MLREIERWCFGEDSVEEKVRDKRSKVCGEPWLASSYERVEIENRRNATNY